MTSSTPSAQQDGLRPIAAVLALVVHERKVLLVRRTNPPDAGHWGFPGGKLFFGETIFEAAVRELREETSVVAEPLRVFTALDALDDVNGSLHAHYILVAVQCQYVCGEPKAADDAADARWFAWRDIANGSLRLSKDVEAIAEQLLGGPPKKYITLMQTAAKAAKGLAFNQSGTS